MDLCFECKLVGSEGTRWRGGEIGSLASSRRKRIASPLAWVHIAPPWWPWLVFPCPESPWNVPTLSRGWSSTESIYRSPTLPHWWARSHRIEWLVIARLDTGYIWMIYKDVILDAVDLFDILDELVFLGNRLKYLQQLHDGFLLISVRPQYQSLRVVLSHTLKNVCTLLKRSSALICSGYSELNELTLLSRRASRYF